MTYWPDARERLRAVLTAWRLGAKVVVRVVVGRATVTPRFVPMTRAEDALGVLRLVGVETRGALAEERGATTVVLRVVGARRNPDRCVFEDAALLRFQIAFEPEARLPLSLLPAPGAGDEGAAGSDEGVGMAGSTGGVEPLLLELLLEPLLEPLLESPLEPPLDPLLELLPESLPPPDAWPV